MLHKRFNRKLLIFLWIVGTLSGCSGVVTGSGTVKSETRQVGQFHGVEGRGSLDIVVSRASDASVKVEADDNLLPLITTEVKDGTLIVDLKASRADSKNPLKVEVTVPKLDHLNLGGSGTLTTSGEIDSPSMSLRCGGSGKLSVSGAYGELDCQLGGSGELKVKGTAETASFTVGGSGTAEASELQVTGKCQVVLAGSGTASVWADGPLNVTMAGSGKVIHKGKTDKPTSAITGTGTITRVP